MDLVNAGNDNEAPPPQPAGLPPNHRVHFYDEGNVTDGGLVGAVETAVAQGYRAFVFVGKAQMPSVFTYLPSDSKVFVIDRDTDQLMYASFLWKCYQFVVENNEPETFLPGKKTGGRYSSTAWTTMVEGHTRETIQTNILAKNLKTMNPTEAFSRLYGKIDPPNKAEWKSVDKVSFHHMDLCDSMAVNHLLRLVSSTERRCMWSFTNALCSMNHKSAEQLIGQLAVRCPTAQGDVDDILVVSQRFPLVEDPGFDADMSERKTQFAPFSKVVAEPKFKYDQHPYITLKKTKKTSRTLTGMLWKSMPAQTDNPHSDYNFPQLLERLKAADPVYYLKISTHLADSIDEISRALSLAPDLRIIELSTEEQATLLSEKTLPSPDNFNFIRYTDDGSKHDHSGSRVVALFGPVNDNASPPEGENAGKKRFVLVEYEQLRRLSIDELHSVKFTALVSERRKQHTEFRWEDVHVSDDQIRFTLERDYNTHDLTFEYPEVVDFLRGTNSAPEERIIWRQDFEQLPITSGLVRVENTVWSVITPPLYDEAIEIYVNPFKAFPIQDGYRVSTPPLYDEAIEIYVNPF